MLRASEGLADELIHLPDKPAGVFAVETNNTCLNMNNQMTIEQLEELMTSKEGEHLEFKEAGKSFHFNTLVKYCAALANEGGGKVVLGVTDKRPRSVVGSQAFKQPERTRFGS